MYFLDMCAVFRIYKHYTGQELQTTKPIRYVRNTHITNIYKYYDVTNLVKY